MTPGDAVLDCGHAPSEHGPHTTGYGVAEDGTRHCYDCCAKQECEAMKATGRAFFYFDGENVTDWSGHLKIPALYVKRGRHNIAGTRLDVWFIFAGARWHGVRYGDNGTYVRCKRIDGGAGRWKIPGARYVFRGMPA